MDVDSLVSEIHSEATAAGFEVTPIGDLPTEHYIEFDSLPADLGGMESIEVLDMDAGWVHSGLIPSHFS